MNAPVVQAPRSRRSWLVFVPLLVFVAVAALLLLRLFAGDASRLPSALIGKPVPSFALVPVDGLGKPGLTTADLARGHVTVLNIFASWCIPCREEEPELTALAKGGMRLVGLAYKDKPESTRQFLNDNGDPFAAVGSDLSGRTGIDFGVAKSDVLADRAVEQVALLVEHADLRTQPFDVVIEVATEAVEAVGQGVLSPDEGRSDSRNMNSWRNAPRIMLLY